MSTGNKKAGKTNFEGLEPSKVWNYFYEVCQVPRPSGKESKIIDYLVNFGSRFHLQTHVDEVGNVVINKPASAGMESLKSVCLQSHLDMVAEKNSSSPHNFETDPIEPIIDGEWVKAVDTTLGADNGIGIAAQLAILSDNSLVHGPLECLFTVDEETGLKGASGLKPGFIKSNILINLDSEDEGELFIGCAGGMDTVATLTYVKKSVPKTQVAYKIRVNGLIGGHSGDDINKERANAIKLLTRFLWTLCRRMGIKLAVIEGGNLRNAIPREAFAVITANRADESKLKNEFSQFVVAIKSEFSQVENAMDITLEPVESPESVLKRKYQRRLLNVLYGCPHGIVSMSLLFKDLVETSTNLASIRFEENNKIKIATSQRSMTEEKKLNIANRVRSVFELAKASVEQSAGYPGWNPNTTSEVLKITRNTYHDLFGTDPVVRAIHAGLECGLFLEKYPQLDMISFGPTIRNAHSPDERLEISTVTKYWDLLLKVLQNIPDEKEI